MANRDLLAAKLGELSDRIGRVRSRCPATSAQLGADRDALDLVSFNLMLAVQSCADISSHIIADQGWPAAPTLAGSFNRLRDQGVISPKTASALGRAVGLRNVVAHGYASVDPAMLHSAATEGLIDLEAFAREVADWLQRQPE